MGIFRGGGAVHPHPGRPTPEISGGGSTLGPLPHLPLIFTRRHTQSHRRNPQGPELPCLSSLSSSPSSPGLSRGLQGDPEDRARMDRAAGVMSRDPSDPLKMSPNGNTSSVLQHTRMVWPHPLCTGTVLCHSPSNRNRGG